MKRLTGYALALIALFWTAPAFAEGPFDGLGGSWRGGGMVTPVNKSPERTKCSRKGSVSNGGYRFLFDLNCTSASIDFSVYFNFASKNGKLTGSGKANGYPVWITGGTTGDGVINASYRTILGSTGTLKIRKLSANQSSANATKVSRFVVAKK